MTVTYRCKVTGIDTDFVNMIVKSSSDVPFWKWVSLNVTVFGDAMPTSVAVGDYLVVTVENDGTFSYAASTETTWSE